MTRKRGARLANGWLQVASKIWFDNEAWSTYIRRLGGSTRRHWRQRCWPHIRIARRHFYPVRRSLGCRQWWSLCYSVTNHRQPTHSVSQWATVTLWHLAAVQATTQLNTLVPVSNVITINTADSGGLVVTVTVLYCRTYNRLHFHMQNAFPLQLACDLWWQWNLLWYAKLAQAIDYRCLWFWFHQQCFQCLNVLVMLS